MNKKRLFPYLLLLTIGILSLFTKCVMLFEPDEWNSEPVLVIEGDIVLNDETSIFISKTAPINNVFEIEYVTDATVTLLVDNGEKIGSSFIIPDEEPPYYSINTKGLSYSSKYKLRVEYDNLVYESDWGEVIKTPSIDSIGYNVNRSDDCIEFYVNAEDSERETGYYRWRYREDWQYRSKYNTIRYFNLSTGEVDSLPKEKNLHYCWNESKSKEIIVSNSEKLNENLIFQHVIKKIYSNDYRINYIYSIELYQYSISKEAFIYWQNVKKNSEDIGGLYSPKPSELNGNIKCVTDESREVLGYISVVEQSKKRSFFKLDTLNLFKYQTCADFPPLPEGVLAWTEIQLHYMGFMPVIEEADSITKPIWIKNNCVDCRIIGGTKKRPDFWPNNDI